MLRALHGLGEPVGVVALEVALHALGAELALVEGEFLPGLEADDLVVLHLELDAALLAAEAAVGLHDLVRRGVGEPTAGRGEVQVGAELGAELVLGKGERAHENLRTSCWWNQGWARHAQGSWQRDRRPPADVPPEP